MTIPVILFTLFSCITAVVVPWLGVVVYYLLAVGQLSALWPQDFGDSRSSLYISLATLVGLGVATATRQVDYRRLGHLPNLLMMLLVVIVNLSVANSPYDGFEDVKMSALSPLEILDIFNKIMVIYFAAVLLIDTRFKLIFLLTVIGGVLMYYTLWANKIYVTSEFWRFGDNGRLNGPLGIYYDENYLAMLFLLATPIFYYMSVGTSSRIIRYGLWFSIPFTWHALFLTGSRGALASLAVVCVYIFFRSYNKKASVILVIGLVVAVIDQSGHLLTRIDGTVKVEEVERDRAFVENTDSDDFSEVIIDPRLISWQVGLKLARDYPLLGVGPGNFMRAFTQYDDSEPHVAHNTFIQFAANCGVIAGMIYLYFLFIRLKTVFKKPDPEKKYPNGLHRDYLDDMLNGLFVAFYCVAFFLDLMVLEILYFVFLVGYCKYALDRSKRKRGRGLIASIYRWKQGSRQQVEETDLDATAGVTLPTPASALYANSQLPDNTATNRYAKSA